MTENSSIGWTDHTANAWIGCTKVARGCTHCYAERENTRRHWTPGWGPGEARHLVGDATWLQYRRWEKRAAATGRTELVFCGSLMDWCDAEAPPGGLDRIHVAWRESPHLLWLMLTKRVECIEECLPADWGAGWPNVALGYSIAEPPDLAKMDAFVRIPALRRFVSYEPAIAWCELAPWFYDPCRLDQVIVGGESGGKDARLFDIQWARDTVRDCKAAGVRVFVKQLGTRPIGHAGRSLCLKHHKGEDPAEWPADLRVQQRIID